MGGAMERGSHLGATIEATSMIIVIKHPLCSSHILKEDKIFMEDKFF